jgi:putative ABC transport system ATP-binding protein
MLKNIEVAFKEVKKTFQEGAETIQVLKGINGEIENGSILTIIGPSGSGKSTILSLCNLLQTPDEGELYIGGKEIRQWKVQDLRRYVGIAFQAAPMTKGTVLENLSLPLRLQGKTLENPAAYMKKVGLPEELLKREAKELSGGQRQRLSLARTLVNRPSVLLLDEVTSALDTKTAQGIEELILEINKEQQTTILWVTHDLNQAQRVGNTTWLIKDGFVAESGPTGELFSNPKKEQTKEFLEMVRDRK